MDQELPKIAGRKSVLESLKPGIYYWCACGLSQSQPFCDGSHKGSSYIPYEFEVKTEKKMALCLCKRTKSSPLCDGSHRDL